MNALAPTFRVKSKPLYETWTHRGLRCSGICFPPSAEDLAYEGPLSLIKGDEAFRQRRGAELIAFGVTDAYAMDVSTSSTNLSLDPVKDLSIVARLPGGARVHSKPGLELDLGVFDPEDHPTNYMWTKGCPGFVATDGEHCVIGHLSRRNAIDHDFLNGKSPSRRENVLQVAMEYVVDQGAYPKDVGLSLWFPTKAKSFSHGFDDPKTGAFNQLMYSDLRKQGYSETVMEPGSGDFSFSAWATETWRKLGSTTVKTFHQLPHQGRFANIREPRFKNAYNTMMLTVEYV